MFGKMVEVNGSSSRKGLKSLFVAVAGVAFFSAAQAKAQNIQLFTTHDDWSSWSNNGDSSNAESAAAQATPDHDGTTINGAGDTNGTGPGNVSGGGGGSLAVAENANTYDFVYSGSYGLPQTPGTFGSTLVNNLASNGGTGLLRFDFTLPTPQASGTYFQLGVVFNYGDYGGSGPYAGTFLFDQNGTAQTITNDGDGWYTEILPYTISRPDLMTLDTSGSTYFQFGLIINSNYDLVAAAAGKTPASYAPISFSVDNLSIVVPEPASMGLIGAGLSALALCRRRRTA